MKDENLPIVRKSASRRERKEFKPYGETVHDWDPAVRLDLHIPRSRVHPSNFEGHSKAKGFVQDTEEGTSIWIDPDQSEESRLDSLSHELTHLKIHKTVQETSDKDLDSLIKRWGLDEEDDSDLIVNTRERIRELQVRIYRDAKGLFREKGESFVEYLDRFLRLSAASKPYIIRISFRAIQRLEQEGHITRSEGTIARKVVEKVIRKYKINLSKI